MRVRGFIRAIPIVVLLHAAPVNGAEPGYVLSIQSLPGCPSEEEIRAATERQVKDPANGMGARIDLGIRATEDGGFVGELSAVDHDGATGKTSIPARTCAEVARAMAITAAIAIDLGGHVMSSAEPAASPPPPPPPPPPPKPELPKPKPLPPPAIEPAPVNPKSPRSTEWKVTASVGARGGLGPDPHPSLELGIDFGDARPEIVAPSVRLSAVGARGRIEEPGHGADLWLLAGRLDLCPLRFGGSVLVLRPCASFEAGAVAAHTTIDVGTGHPQNPTVPWLAAQVLLRAAWFPTPGFFVEIAGGPVFPVFATHYFFEPNRTIDTVPRVTGAGTIGIGLRF